MKYVKYILLLCLSINLQASQAETIDFEGNTIEIDGTLEQLAIHGSDTAGKVTFSNLLNDSSVRSYIKHSIKGSTLKITLSGNSRIRIDIPKNVNILIRPIDVSYEGSYTFGRDARHIHVQDLNGEVEINCDGYDISLYNTSGSLSVVSYENISAILPNLAENSIVSLDTYLGNILLRVPHTLQPKIKASAPKGSITIKGDKVLFNGKNASGNQIILHTENGKQIFVSSLLHLPQGPSNPKLRDQLIKMWIEDQGKLRMDNEARRELTAMGYGPFIESLDDVYKGHFYSIKHRKEFDEIVKKYGFPTEEMVGFQYALGAVRQIILQSEQPYFEKYKSPFIKLFGKEIIDLREKMHK